MLNPQSTILNRHGLGGNLPPSELEVVAGKLDDKEKEIRADLQRITAEPVPEVIADEKLAGQITDTIKALVATNKTVTDAHKTTKAPYLECGKAVDAWKNRLEAEIDALKAKFAKPLTAYLQKKEAEERQRQLDEAKKERDRAEQLAAEAREHEQAEIHDTAGELIEAAAQSETLAERIADNALTAKPSSLAKARSWTGSSASNRLVWAGVITNISAIDLNKIRNCFADDDIQKAVNRFVREGGRELEGVKIEQQSTLSVR